MAVVLALVGDVVVADDDDVLRHVLPQEAAGELAQAERLEVIGDRGSRVGGDVLPLDCDHPVGHLLRPVQRVPSLSPRLAPVRAVIGTRALLAVSLAYDG